MPAYSRRSRPEPTKDGRKLVVTILILAVALAAVLGFAAGFFAGARQAPESPLLPRGSEQPLILPSSGATKQEAAAEKKTLPPPSKEESPESGPEDEAPLKIISAPEATLKAFLSAPDWKERIKHVLHPERTGPSMEAYYATFSDGPIPLTSLRPDAKYSDEASGTKVFSYRVATKEQPDGIPVAVADTGGGWKVDWETFIEFHDDHFTRFARGEGSDRGSFHLIVRNTHYFEAPFAGIEKLTAFRLDPPLPEKNQYGFVTTGSDLHKALAASLDWGKPCTPVLELQRHSLGNGKSYIEITGIDAPNWRPLTD